MNQERQHDKGAGHQTEAVLFGVVEHGDPRTAAEALHELQLLASTADYVVAGCMVQHRRHPDPNTYLGAGKLAELAEVVKLSNSGAVVCDDSLTPNQARSIEQAVQVPVIDRSELILQIFSMHARTPQARLQVELAALHYEMPRLRRKWTHLERQRGGIGVRGGAGEKQIDVDRHLLRQRIASAKRELKRIEQHKVREVAARPELFTVALVGYTNAGKSSLMNRLTEAGVLAENRLFSTLDTRTRPWRLPGGRTILLTDTVGFINKLPHELVASFHATLQEALAADLLLVLVDASSPDALDQLKTVDEVLESLGAGDLPRIHVLNKLDLVEDRGELARLWTLDDKAVPISARTGCGIDELMSALQDALADSENVVNILVPHQAGALLSHIRAKATVRSEFYTEQGCLMEIQVSPALLGRLLAEGARFAHPEERPEGEPAEAPAVAPAEAEAPTQPRADRDDDARDRPDRDDQPESA